MSPGARRTEVSHTPRQLFASDVLATALGGGITRWAAVTDLVVDDSGHVTALGGRDTVRNDSPWQVDLTAIDTALGAVIDHPHDCFSPDSSLDPVFRTSIPSLLRAIRDHLDQAGSPLPRFYADRIDAVMSDVLVRVAIAGEVIH